MTVPCRNPGFDPGLNLGLNLGLGFADFMDISAAQADG
jgi:hypothetical protein